MKRNLCGRPVILLLLLLLIPTEALAQGKKGTFPYDGSLSVAVGASIALRGSPPVRSILPIAVLAVMVTVEQHHAPGQ